MLRRLKPPPANVTNSNRSRTLGDAGARSRSRTPWSIRRLTEVPDSAAAFLSLFEQAIVNRDRRSHDARSYRRYITGLRKSPGETRRQSAPAPRARRTIRHPEDV